MVMLMDRDQESLRFWSPEDISYYAEVLSHLSIDELSDQLKELEFADRIFKFPLQADQLTTASQIRAALERLKGLSNDLHSKAKSIRAGGGPASVCNENLRQYQASQKRQEAYRKHLTNGNAASYRDIKRAKYFCDADVMHRRAIDLRYRCSLLSLTLPDHMHNELQDDGVNLDDLTSTNDGVKYLKKCWRAFNPGSECFGFTVLQMHKSGLPHLHAVLFYPPEKETELRKLFQVKMKKAGAGLSHFSVRDEELSGDGNRAISYLSEGVGDDPNQAAFSRSNGVAARTIQPFGICLHTTLFNELNRRVFALKAGGAFFQSLHDLLTGRKLVTSEKKYKFIRDFIPRVEVIRETVKSESGKSREKIIGIKDQVSGKEIYWKEKEPLHDSRSRAEDENNAVNIKLTSTQKYDAKLTRVPMSADVRSRRFEVKITCIARSCIREHVTVLHTQLFRVAAIVVQMPREIGYACRARSCRHGARIRAPPDSNTGMYAKLNDIDYECY